MFDHLCLLYIYICMYVCEQIMCNGNASIGIQREWRMLLLRRSPQRLFWRYIVFLVCRGRLYVRRRLATSGHVEIGHVMHSVTAFHIWKGRYRHIMKLCFASDIIFLCVFRTGVLPFGQSCRSVNLFAHKSVNSYVLIYLTITDITCVYYNTIIEFFTWGNDCDLSTQCGLLFLRFIDELVVQQADTDNDCSQGQSDNGWSPSEKHTSYVYFIYTFQESRELCHMFKKRHTRKSLFHLKKTKLMMYISSEKETTHMYISSVKCETSTGKLYL